MGISPMEVKPFHGYAAFLLETKSHTIGLDRRFGGLKM
jgi:hypothetical protein